MQTQESIPDTAWPKISEIFEQVGWGWRPPEEVRSAFESSTFSRFALEGDAIVGFGRTVDDGRYYGLIVDLVVVPQFQGQGIGSRLLDELRDCLARYEFCTLTAAPGKDGFYLSQGWKRQSSSFIWPKDSEQKSQHTRAESE